MHSIQKRWRMLSIALALVAAFIAAQAVIAQTRTLRTATITLDPFSPESTTSSTTPETTATATETTDPTATSARTLTISPVAAARPPVRDVFRPPTRSPFTP